MHTTGLGSPRSLRSPYRLKVLPVRKHFYTGIDYSFKLNGDSPLPSIAKRLARYFTVSNNRRTAPPLKQEEDTISHRDVLAIAKSPVLRNAFPRSVAFSVAGLNVIRNDFIAANLSQATQISQRRGASEA